MAVVPIAPPSPEHPLGTVAIVGPDAVYTWDLEARRFLTGHSLGATNGEDKAVVAVRADDEIFVLAGNRSDTFGSAEIVLLTLGLDLAVRSRDVVGRGIMPSLAVSDRWIVAGAFEKHTPAPAAPGTEDQVGDYDLAFHAVVLDRKTRAIVAGRVFQGERLFFPGPEPRWAMHAIAIRDDRAFFSLPGVAEALVVSTALPSLHTVNTLTLGNFGWQTSVPIHAVGRNLIVPTPQGWRLVSPDLVVVQKLDTIGPVLAWSARTGSLLVEAVRGRLPWRSVVLDGGCAELLWTWDHPIGVCGGDESTGEPMRIRFRR